MLGSGQVRYAFACTGMVLVVCVFFVSVLDFFDTWLVLNLWYLCVVFVSAVVLCVRCRPCLQILAYLKVCKARGISVLPRMALRHIL